MFHSPPPALASWPTKACLGRDARPLALLLGTSFGTPVRSVDRLLLRAAADVVFPEACVWDGLHLGSDVCRAPAAGVRAIVGHFAGAAGERCGHPIAPVIPARSTPAARCSKLH